MHHIGRYEVRRELGHGGFGRVYAAFDPTVARAVAIKTLTGVGTPDLLARFRNEAATAGRLRHQNIVTIYDFGEHDGSPFLVMELLEGEDLQSVIANRRELSTYDKVRILWEVADGLQHAHANGIVHRDIKPANIMLLSDRRIKLLDFGIALVAQAAMSRLTPQGNLIGTCRYMSPEQFRGDSPDTLADIFAYGIVCYELLTGAYPFHAADTAAIMYRIVNSEPAPLREHFADCPAGLEAVVLRALAKDRESRYQSLDDIKFDLEPMLLELRMQRAESVLAEAEGRFAAGELEAAQALVREGLELDRGSTAARRLRDLIQHEIQRRAIRPKVEALINLADRRIVAHQFDEAIRDLESALRLDSTNSEVRRRIQSALAARELDRRSEQHADLAKRAFRERNLTGALEHANEALLADPKNTAAAQLLAEIRAELDRRERNRRLFELLRKAKGLLLLQSFDEATELLETAAPELSGTAEVSEMLARVHADRVAHAREIRLLAEINAAKEMLRRCEFVAAAGRLTALREEFPLTAEVRDLLEYALEQSPGLPNADVTEPLAPRVPCPPEPRCEATEPSREGSFRKMRWNAGRIAAATVIVLASSAVPAGRILGGHTRVTPAAAVPSPAPETGSRIATGSLQAENGATDSPSRRAKELKRDPITVQPAKTAAAKAPERVARTLERVDHAAPELPAAPPPPLNVRRAPEVAALPAPPRLSGMKPVGQASLPAVLALNPDSAPAPHWAGDRRDISSALERLEQALAKRSLAQLDAAWPGMPRSTRDSLRRAFRDDNVRYTVRLTPLKAPLVDGDLATVDCERVARTIVAGAGRPDQVTHVRATLRRVSNTWVIQSIQDLR